MNALENALWTFVALLCIGFFILGWSAFPQRVEKTPRAMLTIAGPIVAALDSICGMPPSADRDRLLAEWNRMHPDMIGTCTTSIDGAVTL